jgi:hypothetical protein
LEAVNLLSMSKRTKTIDPYYLELNETVLKHICNAISSYSFAGHKWDVPDDLTPLAAIVGATEVAKLNAVADSAEKNILLRSILSKPLKDPNKELRLAAMEWVVYDWGHVRQAISEKHKTWPKALGNYSEDTVEIFIAERYEDRVASWSKVLAFADASKYAIYDARVAMTLNAMVDEINYPNRFYLPEPSSTVLKKIFQDIRDFVRNKDDKVQKYIGYFDYMKLLREIVKRGAAKNVLEVEMKLFASAYEYAEKYSKKYNLDVDFTRSKKLR